VQTDFVAAVSHEFRSPLTSLGHVAELLVHDRLPDDGDRRRSYGVLLRDSNRLRDLVEGLLDFQRFENGAAFRLAPEDLADIVHTTVAEFRERIAGDVYRVEVTAPSGQLMVHADRAALSRALWNLLDNAVKYSPDCRTVWVDVVTTSGWASVAVRDRGIGIPADEHRLVFGRFARGAESTSRRIRGTGIGLATVDQIARGHRGEVRLTSAPGSGSTFTLVLPTQA
jgi:two-component system phosphate regulon sensor histidine kinase PhoR